MATADYKFVSMTVKNPGANDFAAFTRSQAWDLTKKLPLGYFVMGDVAYPFHVQLLMPYPGRGLRKDYDAFIFYLSQLRIIVKQSFGILVRPLESHSPEELTSSRPCFVFTISARRGG